MVNRRHNREDLVGYDFQGWPIFKMSVKDLLLGLGGREEDNKIVFDLSDPVLEVYPKLLEDDGMGYGVNEECIIEADVFKSNEENDDIIYVNIFREPIPDDKRQEELFNRWDEDERIVNEQIEKMKKSKENS